jgi:cytochrome b561
MTLAASRPAYSVIHRVLHWLIAICVIAAIAAGIMMVNADPGPRQNQLYEWHWSLGATIFVLMILRLVSRLVSPPPPLPATVPRLQQAAANVVHAALYVALLVQPILGYIGKASFGGAIPYFGLFNVPVLLEKDQALAEWVLGVHAILGFVITGLVVVHVLAAFYHAVKLDGVFNRMVTG